MYKTFGETIASLRRAHGMRQQTLADALAEAGVPVSNQAVSKWENDATLPNAQQFLTLCRVACWTWTISRARSPAGTLAACSPG